jgi:hypothetical protein
VGTILEVPDPEKWQIHNIEWGNVKPQMAVDWSVSDAFVVNK